MRTRYDAEHRLVCECVFPRYGNRFQGCLKCGRPPIPEARIAMGLTVPQEGAWASR